MTDQPPHRYRSRGVELGVPEDVLDRAWNRSVLIRANGAEPILSLMHLAVRTGTPHAYLRKIIDRSVDPYFDLVKLKPTGGKRAISAPEPTTLGVQRFLLDNVLSALPHHDSSHAYRVRRSAVSCARNHIGARWLVKMDLHDFFDTVAEPRVYETILSLGYSELVAFELTRLCTRVDPNQTGRARQAVRTLAFEKYTAIPGYQTGVLGVLPQGAPTSGVLANAVATGLDEALFTRALADGLVYTRYSDDLTFSTSRPFNRSTAAALIGDVHEIVSDAGFVVHQKKTRIVPPGGRRMVLGLLVDGERVRLRPEFRRQLELKIHGTAMRGVRGQATRLRFESFLAFVAHVDGALAYAHDVEPAWADKARSSWIAALRADGFPI